MQRISSWFEGRLPLRRRGNARRADVFAAIGGGEKQKFKRQPVAENNSGNRLSATQPFGDDNYCYWLQCANKTDDFYADCNLPLWKNTFLPPAVAVKTSKSAAPTSRQNRTVGKIDKTDMSGRKRVASGGCRYATLMDVQIEFNNTYDDDSDSSSDSEDLGYGFDSSHLDVLNNNNKRSNKNNNRSSLVYSSMRIRGNNESTNHSDNNNAMARTVTSRNSIRQRIRTNPWISTVDRSHAQPQHYQNQTTEQRGGSNAYASTAISRSGSGSSSSTSASEPACGCVTSGALSKRLNESTCSAASATSSGYGSADVVSSPECSVHRPDWESAVKAEPIPECCGCCCQNAFCSGKSSRMDVHRKSHDDDDVHVCLTGSISPASTLMGACQPSFDRHLDTECGSDGTDEHIYHELENTNYSYHEAVGQLSCQQYFHSNTPSCSMDRSNKSEINNNAYRCESPIYAIPRSRFSADTSTMDYNGNNEIQPLARLRPEAVAKRRVTRPQRMVLDWATDASAASSTEEEDNGCGTALLKRHLTPTRQRYFVATAEADADADEMSFASSSSSSTSTSCHSWMPMMTVRDDVSEKSLMTTKTVAESSAKRCVGTENDFIAELDQQISELQLQSDAVRHLVERAKERHEMRLRTRQLCMEHLRELRKMRWIMHHNFELCL